MKPPVTAILVGLIGILISLYFPYISDDNALVMFGFAIVLLVSGVVGLFVKFNATSNE